MTKKKLIEQFLTSKCIAISGVSKNPKKYSRVVFKTFLDRNFNVLPINPSMNEVDNKVCYPSVNSLPDTVDAIIIINKGDKVNQIFNEAVAKGIKNIWIYLGAELKNPQFEGKNINLIVGECPILWLNPVQGFHKFHLFIRNLFSRED